MDFCVKKQSIHSAYMYVEQISINSALQLETIMQLIMHDARYQIILLEGCYNCKHTMKQPHISQYCVVTQLGYNTTAESHILKYNKIIFLYV